MNKINKTCHIHIYACLCQRGEGVSVSNWHFLVVVPQPISFCILKNWANHSIWFIFPHIIPHFLPRHFLAKCIFHSSVHSQQSCQSRGWWKRNPWPPVEKIQKLIQQTFRDEYIEKLLHLKSNFISLKSVEGLAALVMCSFNAQDQTSRRPCYVSGQLCTMLGCVMYMMQRFWVF